MLLRLGQLALPLIMDRLRPAIQHVHRGDIPDGAVQPFVIVMIDEPLHFDPGIFQ